ncbi:hypothetical protein CAEBREN_12964 [Caenorhabditis brenneri]|uniref:Uncharacterized protein n=1 Tax=Caenorhabditis brenneri TaxID=135651 RepID=G0PC06_CAEBE|nr:hypothetical protein CAEBREN_12964 [Caenorhabditis brenneri]
MQKNQQPWRQLQRPTTSAAAAAIAAFPPNPRPPQSNLSSIRRFPIANNSLSPPPKLSPPPSGYEDEEEPTILDDNAPPPPTLAPPTTATPKVPYPNQRSAVPSAAIPPQARTQGYVPRPPVTTGHHPLVVQGGPSHYQEADPRCSELVTRLFISTGIPLNAVNDPTFIDMIKHFNSNTVLPTETAMTRGLEKHCKNQKPVAHYHKSLAPLCVTIDVGHGTGDQKFLAYSIHYFEDLYERKNVVYLKKLFLSVVDSESVLIPIRRAVNSYSYSNVKFANLVCPSQELYKMLCGSDVCKRYYVDYNFYIKKFVLNLLKIQELSQGLQQFRTFCRFIKSNVDTYGRYRRLQLSKGHEMNIPDLDDESWYTSARFLTHCLSLHDDFNDFCRQNNHDPAISNETFLELLYFQRLLSECIRHSAEVSAPDNSISQVMPSIMALRNYISMSKPAESYANHVRDAFTNSFSTVTRGSAKILYDIATLMDPRYAYKTEIYNMQTWQNLEIRAIEEFVNMDPAMEKCYYNDVSLLTPSERHAVIANDFKIYREFLGLGGADQVLGHRDHRPLSGETPNFWWGRRQTDMEYLAVLSREYLATPATTINATCYFNKGKGKFDRISKMYPRPQIDDCLTVAGTYQVYRGKGYLAEKNRMTSGQKEKLAAIEKRLITNGMIEMEEQMVKMEEAEPMDQEEMKPEIQKQMEVKVEDAPLQAPPLKKRRGIMRR